jgi:hypothetical protein
MGLGSRIRKKPIPDPGSGSRGQKGTGSWIRIRNTDTDIVLKVKTYCFANSVTFILCLNPNEIKKYKIKALYCPVLFYLPIVFAL